MLTSQCYCEKAEQSCLHSRDLLCSAECQLKVMFAVSRGQDVVVKLCGEERVDEGAECHAVTPAGWEVLDVDVLQINGREWSYYISQHTGVLLPYPSTQSQNWLYYFPGPGITQLDSSVHVIPKRFIKKIYVIVIYQMNCIKIQIKKKIHE